MRFLYTCAIFSLLAACKPASQNADGNHISVADSTTIVAKYLESKKLQDSTDKTEQDSSKAELFRALGIFNPKNATHEFYVLLISKPPFLQPDFVYMLERTAKHEFQLTTKVVFAMQPNTGRDTMKMHWKNKTYTVTDITVAEEHIQPVTEEQYYTYTRLLESSYYWAFEDPCPEGSGWTDGEFWTLITFASRPCSRGQLQYHQTSIHVPQGSFRAAGDYLASISEITKHRKR